MNGSGMHGIWDNFILEDIVRNSQTVNLLKIHVPGGELKAGGKRHIFRVFFAHISERI